MLHHASGYRVVYRIASTASRCEIIVGCLTILLLIGLCGHSFQRMKVYWNKDEDNYYNENYTKSDYDMDHLQTHIAFGFSTFMMSVRLGLGLGLGLG